jgi:signal transduction histidine kinase
MMVERVSANSKRLLTLINDFLDLSKIESGRLQLVSTPLSPRALMDNWRLEMSGLAEEKGLTFTTIVSPNVPDTLYGDEEAITRIATNLIYNAIKFTEQGRVVVQMHHQNDWLVLEVSDTGVGIPPHAQEYIFDEFRQLDSSSRRIHGGAGLGLSVVRRLCHLMEGTVQVSSVVGEGSVFTVKLPLKTSLVSERGA